MFRTAPAATPALEVCVSSGPDRSPWLSAAAEFPLRQNSGVAPCAPRQLSMRIYQIYAGPPSCAHTHLHKHKTKGFVISCEKSVFVKVKITDLTINVIPQHTEWLFVFVYYYIKLTVLLCMHMTTSTGIRGYYIIILFPFKLFFLDVFPKFLAQ